MTYAGKQLGSGDHPGARATLERARPLVSGPGLERAAVRIEIDASFGILGTMDGTRAPARAMLEREILAASKALGADHPRVLEAKFALARLMGMADRARRLELFIEVARGRERRLGPRHSSVASSLIQAGITSWRSGRMSEADSILRRAVALAESLHGDNRYHLSYALNMYGNVLEAEGRVSEAREALLRAFRVRETMTPHPHNTALILNDLANVELARDEFVSAQSLYDRAVAIAERATIVPPAYLGLYLQNAGFARMRLGDYAGALRYLERAVAKLDSLEEPATNWHVRALTFLGQCRMATGDTEAGLESIERAYEIGRSFYGAADPQLANLELQVAQASAQASRESIAVHHLGQARQVLANGPPILDLQSECDELEARIRERQRDVPRAETLYRKAVALAEEEHATNAWLGTTMASLARTLRKQGRMAEAESVAARAVSVFELGRKRLPEGIERAGYVSRHGSPYPELASIRMARGAVDAAWEAAESDLGRALADLLQSTGGARLEPREATVQDSLHRRLNELEQRYERRASVAKSDTSAKARDEWSRALLDLQEASAAWGEFQLALSKRYPVAEGRPLDLASVQRTLDAKTALVGWLDLQDPDREWQSWGYVVRASGPVDWVRLEGRGVDPFVAVAGYRRELWNSRHFTKPPEHHAKALWTTRIEPLLPALRGVKHLVAVTSGPMAGIPIEAARDEKGRMIAERFTVSYAPSATVFAMLNRRAGDPGGTNPRRALVVGNPQFHARSATAANEPVARAGSSPMRGVADSALYRSALGGDPEALARMPELPGTRAEAEALARIATEAVLLLGADASEERLVELANSGAMESFGTLHFATHALADDERPWRSSLLLSRTGLSDGYEAAIDGKRVFDGRVTAAEILREWRIRARLVTLSACQTGMGRNLGGEGIVGLAHAFLQAGAQSVLASLWPVDDRATSLLMARFYEEWLGTEPSRRGGRKTISKTEALRRAKQWLQRQPEYQSPFYWAGFVLVGDPS